MIDIYEKFEEHAKRVEIGEKDWLWHFNMMGDIKDLMERYGYRPVYLEETGYHTWIPLDNT